MDCLGCATESPIKLPQSGCRCFCLACWGSVIDNAMASPKTSPVDIKCPSCQKRVYIRDLALVTQGPTRQLIASILKTIPRTSTPSALSDFCYAYDAKGVLRHIETNATFRFVNNRHYEALGEVVEREIQTMMTRPPYNLKELWLPLNEGDLEDLPSAADSSSPPSSSSSSSSASSSSPPSAGESRSSNAEGKDHHQQQQTQRSGCNIFVSRDLFANRDKLLLVFPGGGAVRAGQWGRALCINESLAEGAMFEYIAEAQKAGMAIVILNPNLNVYPQAEAAQSAAGPASASASASASTSASASVGVSAAGDELDREAEFFSGSGGAGGVDKRPWLAPAQPYSLAHAGAAAAATPIPGSEDAVAHALYVYERLLRRAPAQHVFAVAHSAGGSPCMRMLGASAADRERERGRDAGAAEGKASPPARAALLERLVFCAFTDSVHSCLAGKEDHLRETMFWRCVNYVPSQLPLDTVVKQKGFVHALDALANAASAASASASDSASSAATGERVGAEEKESPPPQQQPQQQQQQPPRGTANAVGWVCAICTLQNEPASSVCDACTTPRQAQQAPPAASAAVGTGAGAGAGAGAATASASAAGSEAGAAGAGAGAGASGYRVVRTLPDPPLPSAAELARLGVELDKGCPCVSAGRDKHANTSAGALRSVFAYFDARYQQQQRMHEQRRQQERDRDCSRSETSSS